MSRKPNLSAWNVLIVDDDLPSLALTKTVLAQYKANVHVAASGSEALSLLGNMPRPIVILADIWMPHMSGFVLLEEVRHRPSLTNIPVIAVTALAMVGDREHILSAGFDGYISKPYRVPTLVYDIIDIIIFYIDVYGFHLFTP